MAAVRWNNSPHCFRDRLLRPYHRYSLQDGGGDRPVRRCPSLRAAFRTNQKCVQQSVREPDGQIEGDTQSAYALALDFDLLPGRFASQSRRIPSRRASTLQRTCLNRDPWHSQPDAGIERLRITTTKPTVSGIFTAFLRGATCSIWAQRRFGNAGTATLQIVDFRITQR